MFRNYIILGYCISTWCFMIMEIYRIVFFYLQNNEYPIVKFSLTLLSISWCNLRALFYVDVVEEYKSVYYIHRRHVQDDIIITFSTQSCANQNLTIKEVLIQIMGLGDQ